MNTLTIAVPVSADLISSIIETAVEGGIDYWAESCKYQSERKDGETLIVGALIREIDEKKVLELTPLKIVLAIQKILDGEIQINEDYRKSIWSAIVENDPCHFDAADTDCILQVALFDEIRYG